MHSCEITIIWGDEMRTKYGYVVFSILFGLIVPFIIISMRNKESEVEPEKIAAETVAPQVYAELEKKEIYIPVLCDSGESLMMELDDYLVGVVLAEMPASFHKEALKAQAVVARTYTLKRAENGGKHQEGAVCMKSSCCQAYTTREAYLGRGNEEEMLRKVENAVDETSGQVLLYQGAYIEATYFSCSGGSTEAAVAVWGSDVPYLQAVESPGEEIATHYEDTVSFSLDQFYNKLGLLPQSNLQLGGITYTDGGGVDSVTISGKTFKGTSVRSALGLRSTMFTISFDGTAVSIKTNGFGHRVGMSQYGAQVMAESGKSYQEILMHYYQGTSLGTA